MEPSEGTPVLARILEVFRDGGEGAVLAAATTADGRWPPATVGRSAPGRAPECGSLDSCTMQGRFGGRTPLGHPPYPETKAEGKQSMAGKAGKREGASRSGTRRPARHGESETA